MTRKTRGALAAMVLALLVAGCFVLPGKFGSEMALRRDGTFAFNYTGQIYVLALADPDKAGGPAPVFTAEPCYDQETIEEKTCTADELAEQKTKWEADQKEATDKKKQDAEMTKAMLGGIDPSDPKAGDELAARLMRQEGWKSVIYRGNGLFDVDYRIAGHLDHDFVFPTMEKMPGVQPFVTAIRRNDGTVRVEAPGFGGGGAASPMLAIMQAMGGMPGSKSGDAKGEEDKLPKAEGEFSVVTDGEILANDTDEGPKADPAGKRLHWKVDARTASAPTTLIRLAN